MSDEKNLSDDLNDMLGDAKDGAKKAANKTSEKAKEFAEDAKEAASEFAEEVKEVLSDGKNVAIIAHITLIGWVIALVMNSSNKTELGSFYIRQVLGIGLIGLILSFIPLINVIGWILVLILWIMSLVGALSGEKKLTPMLGAHFQDWFKAL
ncbi:YtxH domain-containing protein [Tamlana flava]|uniref:YtxH domain-containing protein n=1 Tax=Tamlana flava TaxID=3158572 RepID=UPI00351AC471